MSDDLVLRIPHRLGADEAKRRLASGIEAAKSQYGRYVNVTALDWTADRLTFGLSALGQSIQGSVDVEEDYVELRAQLPLMIRMLTKRFLPTVRDTGQKLLT